MGLFISKGEKNRNSVVFNHQAIDDLNNNSILPSVIKLKRSRKRKLSIDFENNTTSSKLYRLDTPKYVYKKLFLEGCDSDVIIHAFGKHWNLHRVYLEQCDYFRALFQGNWSDSYKNEYNLEIIDKNITFSGLNNVLASLYNNEIEIDQKHIASVISAASMLNLTSILNRCNNILSTYLSYENILLNLNLSETYGFVNNLNNALEFLKYSFWRFAQKLSFLKQLQRSWFVKILSSDILCVKENEMDLYLAIKNWIYLQHFPDGFTENENYLNEEKMREFFNSHAYNWQEYYDILKYLRVSQLTLLLNTTKIVKKDGVIPKEIIDWVMRDHWNTLLINEESTSVLNESMDDDFFYRHCFRLGRCGNIGIGKTMWRWLGYFFGTDLLVTYSNGSLRFMRNCTNFTTQQYISIKMCEKIRIHYRVIVCCESDGQIVFDSKRSSILMEVDSSINIGLFKIPKSFFSVHVFYLASIPGPSSIFYWDNLLQKQN